MDIPQLKAVVTLAEELHFVRAARRLGITQPALSQRIQRAEAEVGAALFVRSQRRVALSEAGRVFVADARTVVANFDRAVATARRVSQGEIGRLRLGFVENASFHLLPRAASQFRRKHPNCSIELNEMISIEIAEALAAGQLDLGLMRPIEHETDLSTRLVLSEPYAVALAENHPLANAANVWISDIAPLPLIIAAGRKATYLKTRFRPYFLRHGYDLNIGQEVNQLAAIIALVGAGLGYTLLPLSATGLQVPGVVYRPLANDDAPSAELTLAWRSGDTNPLLTAFAKLCSDQAALSGE
jgi:DNA-binding transcriptional LysR family regulator